MRRGWAGGRIGLQFQFPALVGAGAGTGCDSDGTRAGGAGSRVPGRGHRGPFRRDQRRAVRGDQALVGSTGTFCVPAEKPRCFTSTDPAAVLSGGKPFGTLWAQADQATSSNVYKLAPCVKIGGRWYLHLPSS